MSSTKVNIYINEKYNDWLGYTKSVCISNRSHLEPCEALNHSLCTILEKDKDRIENLIDRHVIDFYVKRIVKVNVTSPRSSLRYTKGQHCTTYLDAQIHYVSSVHNEDVEVRQNIQLVRDVFNSLDIPPGDKEIFEWKFFSERSFSKWEGTRSCKYLYCRYNRVYAALKKKIEKLLKD